MLYHPGSSDISRSNAANDSVTANAIIAGADHRRIVTESEASPETSCDSERRR